MNVTRPKNKRRTRRLIALALILAVIAPYLWWENTTLELTELSFSSERLPADFDGYRIVQVSDLHNCSFGKEQEKLLRLTKEADPDCIVITGDLVENASTENAMDYVRGAAKIAPVYYVPGNHEAKYLDAYRKLRNALSGAGVTLLENTQTLLRKGGSQIRLLGLLDPAFETGGKLHGGVEQVSAALNRMTGSSVKPMGTGQSRDFTILLSHRPELMDLYEEQKIDLAFAGHTHGGLVRLPVIGAPYGLNQGFFPQYTEGLCRKGNTAMVVSRGLGNNFIGWRINNRPELVAVELHHTLPATVAPMIQGRQS